MSTNYPFRRFFVIFANVFIFLGALAFLGFMSFSIIDALTSSQAQIKNQELHRFIVESINNKWLPLIMLFIYLASMQLVYSFMIIKWTATLNDEEYIKLRWLVLIYGFFNFTFASTMFMANIDSRDVESGVRPKQKLAWHQSIVFTISGFLISVVALLLVVKHTGNEDITVDITNQLLIIGIVGGVTLLIGLLGFFSIKTLNKVATDEEYYAKKNAFSAFMIGFNNIFVITKMIILLIVNTLGYIAQMFDRESSFFSRLNASLSLILMYMIVYQVLKVLTVTKDQTLTIDLTNVRELKAKR